MKYLLKSLVLLSFVVCFSDSKAQISTTQIVNSESPFSVVRDSVSRFEKVKGDKYDGIIYSDEGTNDPTKSGMTLEYWGTQPVYTKTNMAGEIKINIIYIPKLED